MVSPPSRSSDHLYSNSISWYFRLQENPLARPHSSSGPSPVAKKSGGLFSSSTRQSTPAPAPTPQVVQHVVEVKAAEADPPYKWLVRIIMTVINLGLGIMVAATGALGLKESSSVDDTGIVFVGIYLLIFATILFVYEFVQIYPCQFCDLPLKRNFGFLYGTNGKGLYMVL